MQKWGDAKNATSWLRPFFFSILSFVFHLPLFLVQAPETFSTDEHKDADGPITRKIFLSYEKSSKVLAITRRVINIVASGLYYASLQHVAPAKTEAQSNGVYFTQTTYALRGAVAANILMFISLGLWLLTYIYMRYHYVRLSMHHPTSTALKVPHVLYYIVCFDPVNFSLDIPGLGLSVAFYTCVIVRLINIIYGSIYAFLYVCEMPMIKCWGCYQKGTAIEDLDLGLCASCPRLSAQDVLPSVCDHAEVECGRGDLLWQDMLSEDIWLSTTLLTVSGCIYLFYNCSRRLEYYERARVEGVMARS